MIDVITITSEQIEQFVRDWGLVREVVTDPGESHVIDALTGLPMEPDEVLRKRFTDAILANSRARRAQIIGDDGAETV